MTRSTQDKEWLAVKEGSALYDASMNPEYFRREYCADGGILQQLGGLRTRWGAQGKRRVLKVSRTVILELIEEEKRRRVG